jgi:trimethylamine--corrinoid protein Co-methyltransferase
MKPTLQLLTDDERQAIAGTAFELLARVGVRLTEPEARTRLQQAGARFDGDRAFIPADLVRQALRTAPHGVSLYSRDGSLAMRLEGRRAYFGAHTDAPDVLDPYSHARRPCLEADVVRHARLADALPNISFVTASGLVADRPADRADRVALGQCLCQSTKPVLVMPVSLAALEDIGAMAALAVGGPDVLRARPNIVVYAEPVSPLVHPDESLRKLLTCAERAWPVVYSPFAAMGGTAPQSLPALLAQLCAESLSALVVHQLAAPGAPFIFGGMASVMDMRTTVFSYGAPEFQLGNSLMAEMAHFFELPNFGTGGTSDAQAFDGQAVLEAATSCLLASLTGAHLVHDVGLLGNATVIMPEMITATDEMVAMLGHLLGEVAVNAETLSLDLFAEAAAHGEFVTQPYTLEHMHDVWYPALLYRRGAKAWAASAQETFEQRVNARTRRLMESHQPPPLPPGVADQVLAIAAGKEVS